MSLTPAQNRLKILLQIWMICFLGSTVVFLFFGNGLLEAINNVSTGLTPALPLIPLPDEKFWLTLTLSLMTTLIFLCYWGQRDIQKNLSAVVPLLVSKFASTLFFFIFLITEGRSLAYFVGVVTDGSIFLITYAFYQKVKKETQC